MVVALPVVTALEGKAVVICTLNKIVGNISIICCVFKLVRGKVGVIVNC